MKISNKYEKNRSNVIWHYNDKYISKLDLLSSEKFSKLSSTLLVPKPFLVLKLMIKFKFLGVF